jgi:hypothetical protein
MLTRVVIVCVVGAVVLVVVVLETLGFQMSKTQKLGLVIGADSAPILCSSDIAGQSKVMCYLRQKSVPLDAPVKHRRREKTSNGKYVRYKPLSNVTKYV